ncbi:MAG TPA: DUF4398 domain-containing protein [Vicinamibacterales bacterium]|nr:DUF4398 domain-containing protein [Vicinamibacterales bacterium]
MLRLVVRLVVPLVAALALSACAAPPEAEMTEAREALAAARAAGAERYAPAEYGEAAGMLQRSERFVAEGDYRQALSAALEARELANAAAAAAGGAKEAARARATTAMDQAQASLAAARAFTDAATAKPPRTRPERLHVSEVRRAVVAANVAVQKAREAIGRDDFAAATEALDAVRAQLDEVMAAKPEPPPPPKPRRRR